MLNHQAGTVYIFGVMKMPLFFFFLVFDIMTDETKS